MNLTPKQQRVLKYIEGYINEHACAPTFKDLMLGLDLKSKSSVTRYLDILVERGKIQRLHRRERAIEIVTPTTELAADVIAAAINLLDNLIDEGDETTTVRSTDIGRLDLAVAEWEACDGRIAEIFRNAPAETGLG